MVVVGPFVEGTAGAEEAETAGGEGGSRLLTIGTHLPTCTVYPEGQSGFSSLSGTPGEAATIAPSAREEQFVHFLLNFRARALSIFQNPSALNERGVTLAETLGVVARDAVAIGLAQRAILTIEA